MDKDDLEVLLGSRIPVLIVESHDETEVLKALVRASMRLPIGVDRSHADAPLLAAKGLPLFQWTVTDGLKRLDVSNSPPIRTLVEPLDILKHIRATTVPGTYALLDFHPYLDDATNLRLLKDIALDYAHCARTIVLISYAVKIPREIEHLSARCSLALPDRNQRRQIVEDVARQWMRDNAQRAIRVDKHAVSLLVENMNGLTASDIQRLARKAIVEDGALLASSVPALMQAKYDLLNHNGILRYEHDAPGLGEVGGLSKLKAWLAARRAAYDGSAPQLDAPKGILLLGVQGCGKSLAARACAGIFQVPLLRLDCGALFDKFVGESERNLRESLETADLLAPCVLWVDEIEKGFASGDNDGGATRRVLGTFLTWLADKASRIFVVATANDMSSLPPELIRKGRFDEIFFVDLPNITIRREILKIHAAKRGIALEPEQLSALAASADGFTGAEIEQAVVATLYTAHAKGVPPDATLLGAEIAATRPLEVVMAEKIAALREWADGRTVSAD